MAIPQATFNPEAATSAYLETHAAECRTLDCTPHHGPWIGLVLPAVTLLALWLFLLTRLSDRARNLAKRLTNHIWLQGALFAIPLTLFVGAVRLAGHFYLERVAGISGGALEASVRDDHGIWIASRGSSLVGWLATQLGRLGETTLVVVVALPIAFLLIRRMSRHYWVIFALAASLWLFWMMAHNSYGRITPLPPGPLRADIEAMAQTSGLSGDRVQLGEQELFSGGLMDAHVIWWRGRPHAILSERLFNILPVAPQNIRPPYRPVTASEVRAIAGHELAHLQLLHLYIVPIILLALLWLAAWLAAAGAKAWVSKSSRSWRVDGLADLAALPAIGLVFGIAFCALLPLNNALEQAVESQADAVGLDIARDPDGFAALAMRDARGRPISRPFIEQWLFYDHPSAENRIRRAMEWKARHQPASWRATGDSAPIRVRM